LIAFERPLLLYEIDLPILRIITLNQYQKSCSLKDDEWF
jgi:hypothetical protein